MPSWRRSLVALVGAWAVATVLVAAVGSWISAPAGAQGGPPSEEDGDRVDGETLWRRDCASCHGVTGDGTAWGPALHDKGPAGVALSVETGRMPVTRLELFGEAGWQPGDVMERGERPAYPPEQVDALVEHTRGFLDGPEVTDVDPARGDLSRGQQLYQLNCAACHGWSGRGGALTSGEIATTLTASSPTQVVQAMRTGIGTMPVFGEDAIDEEEAAAVAAYVRDLRNPRAEGGAGLAFRGPFSEGAVAWIVGILAILAAVRWIGVGR